MKHSARCVLSFSVLLIAGAAQAQAPTPVPAASASTRAVEGKYAAAAADRGKLEILAAVPVGTGAQDLEVTGLPKASIESVRPFASLSSHTVFVVDGSGSFRGARTHEAKAVLAEWARLAAIDATHTAQVIVFGDQVTAGEVRTARADFEHDVDALLAAGAPGSTMLYTGLERGIELAIASSHDLRSIWILTDGGDSSKGLTEDTVERLITKAAADRVRVFTATTVGDHKSAEYITRLEKIVSATGGDSIPLGTTADPLQKLRSLLDDDAKLSLILAKPCGLGQTTQLEVALQHNPTNTSSSPLMIRSPAWGPSVFKSCCDPAQCTGIMACAGNSCEAKACSRADDCGPDSHCAGGRCATGAGVAPPPPHMDSRLVWWLAGGAALLALLAAGLMARARAARAADEQRAREAEALRLAEQERLRAAQAAAATAAPAVKPVAGSTGPIQELPEVHLVVQLGPSDVVGKRFRLARRSTLVGSAASNQIRIDTSSVSGEHAEFQLFPTGTVYVKDLDSTNGVTVDGVRLPRGGRQEVKPGAQISLCSSVRLELFIPGAVVERPGGSPPSPSGPAPAAVAQTASVPPAKKSTVFDRD